MGERNDAACAYLGHKEHLADFLNVVYYRGIQEVAGWELENCKRLELMYAWPGDAGKMAAKVVMRDGKGRYYAIFDVVESVKYRYVVTVGRMECEIADVVEESGQGEWEVKQVVLDGLKEEDFCTGFRALVGVLKRRDNKRTMKKFWREQQDLLENLDDETYIVISILSGNKKLLRKKEKYYREGGFDMCKAMEEMLREREQRGEQRGERRGERRGEELGEKRGEIKGIHRVNELNKRLIAECRLDDLKKASSNQRYQKMLLKEFRL